MKRVAALMLVLLGAHAHADCQDNWLTHASSTLHLSVDYSQGCYQGELVLSFSTIAPQGRKQRAPAVQPTSIPFDHECPSRKKNQDGEVVAFSCRADGASPLAGASYRLKQVKTTIRCDGVDLPDVDFVFICTSGCQPATPKRLKVSHGEGCA